MSEAPSHVLDSIGGLIGSVLAGSQGFDPHVGHLIGSTASKFARGLFSPNTAATDQILSLYAAILRRMAESTGGLDDSRRERIVRILTLLNSKTSPAVDAVTMRRLAEDATRDEELIQLANQELSQDTELAYTVLDVCFKYAALELVLSDGMIQWLHASAMGLGLPRDRFNDLLAAYHRGHPDDSSRTRAAEILGIPLDASRDEADSAFERLSSPYHPDHIGKLSPEIAELVAAKYREIGEAHDAFLTPTSWWARATEGIKAVPLAERTSVSCPMCDKHVQLPVPELRWTARCPVCLVLLLHDKSVMETIVRNILATRGTL